MTSLPHTPAKRKCHRTINNSIRETNNNSKSQFNKQQSARNFAIWYKRMIDNDRQNLTLYLSDDVMLEWFDKTIKTRKKVSFFLKYDMQSSRHEFTTVESIEKIHARFENTHRKDDSILANPLHSPEIGIPRRCKRKIDTGGNSPQWAEGCKPDDDDNDLIAKKRVKSHDIVSVYIAQKYENNIRDTPEEGNEVGNKGDGVFKRKRKFTSITPPNIECGQGDCLPSTSGTSNSEVSHDTLNAQLPKLAVECNGYVGFDRTRNNRSTDSMKWDRKCKIQVSYSEDPLNVGEYIIWGLRYSDESKCRRNLLAAFEEAAKE
ncbi:uncharacterized protein LOC112051083 [Bicyclus anynana]|uniref:Uncharacterized protein LOC112051083 n=1 Tax=Bicyclus anynana TaxID=110368 RepID=A0A6J1NEK4_BICAN|nr:uncharacterized protein LOC112051083 [Bicyclus anynana]